MFVKHTATFNDMVAGGPQDDGAPAFALCAFATRSISSCEELTLHYGRRYGERREYAIGDAATARFTLILP